MVLPRARLFAAVVALLVAEKGAGKPDGPPHISGQFPVKESGNLSPPIVSPVGECARAVHVSGFVPHAIIRVFVNSAGPIGTRHAYFADDDVPLSVVLKLGDKVTATQEVLGITSAPSVDPMVVGPSPSGLNTPVAGPDLFACGQVVPVDKLNPGTRVDVFRNGALPPIGEADATQTWQPVVTKKLDAVDQVTAVQTACPDDPAKKIVSLPSAPVGVKTAPNPPGAPTLEPYPVGADAVVLNGLFVGAEIRILDHTTAAGGGLATAARNRAPLNPSASSSSSVSVMQELCSPSSPSPPTPPSTSLNAPTLVTPVCAGTHYVTVQDAYPNAIVVLLRNGIISGMAGGVLGTLQMALGNGAIWTLGDEIRVVEYVGNIFVASNVVFADCAPQNVLTQHNDNNRSGAYLVETHLTPSKVGTNTFGRIYTRQVDGDTVSQPLYMRAVRTPSMGLKNLFFVTTSKNNVYGFDADNTDQVPTHGLVWQRNLCPSLPTGVCGETWSHLVGITSTPVIDPSTQTMFVVNRCSGRPGSEDDGAIFIHAINVADGTDRVASVRIHANDPAHPNIAFDFHCQRNRPGLLLSRGVVYVAFATFSCDAPCASAPYHGWVLGYRESDLKQVAVFNTSPQQGQVGIWQTGNGLAAAADGSIYFQTGNGPAGEPLQDSFVKLTPTNTPQGLTLGGSFSPNDATTLSNGDTDLGSGGPMLLPQGHMVGGGKQGRYYVLHRSTMALSQDSVPDSLGYNGFQAFINTYHNDSNKPACPVAGGAAGCDPTAAGHACYIEPKRYANGELCGPNIHGGPVFWAPSGSFGYVYEMAEKDFLKAFRYDLATGQLGESPSLVASGTLARPPTDGMPGGYSSVSANVRSNGIVWTSMPFGDGQWNPVPGRVAAFDAVTLKQLWSDDDDVLFAKSVPPTIADGKVIRATAADQVIVYGLLPSRFVPPKSKRKARRLCASIMQKHANLGGASGLLGGPIGDEMPVNDSVHGTFRDYRRELFGMTETLVSRRQSVNAPIPTCSVPEGKTVAVESSIYWNPKTCAHVVMGEIRELWLKTGGPGGRLGYPVEDETLTSDHLGRKSVFEHGQIWWYPDKGAYLKRR